MLNVNKNLKDEILYLARSEVIWKFSGQQCSCYQPINEVVGR